MTQDELLRARVKSLPMTNRQKAEKLGYKHESSISEILSGRQSFPAKRYGLLADLLGMSVSQLLDERVRVIHDDKAVVKTAHRNGSLSTNLPHPHISGTLPDTPIQEYPRSLEEATRMGGDDRAAVWGLVKRIPENEIVAATDWLVEQIGRKPWRGLHGTKRKTRGS